MTDFVYVNDLPEDDTPSGDARSLYVNEAGTELVQGPTHASYEADLDGRVNVLGDGMTGGLTIDAVSPQLSLIAADGVADAKLVRLLVNSTGHFQIAMRNDDGTSQVTPLTVRRDGEVRLTGAPSVTVPAAAADGQALAHSQNNAVLGSTTVAALTATGDVTLDSLNPSYVLRDTSQAANLGRFVVQSTNDRLILRRVNDAGAEVATPFQIMSDNSIKADLATSVTVPAAADGDTATAAQTTAKDSTTGQVQVNGIEIGDTGWRDVTSLCSNITAGSIYFRREGGRVSIRLDETQFTTSGNTAFWTPTAGFGFSLYDPLYFGYVNFSRASASTRCLTIQGVGGGALVSAPAPFGSAYTNADVFRGGATYLTDDAWPSSLPGTPVAAQMPA